MRWHEGDRVRVEPVLETDAYILNFQDSGQVTRVTDRGFYVQPHSATFECGPIPAERLKADR